uniref:Ribonuclease A-domain domain-containing protein n=2 Tax=Oreochromis TaxID=8139 RepID=I3KZK3_ORENI
MRIQCVCLLLLLLSPAVLLQNYEAFKKKHILPENVSHKCDDMMKNINEVNKCKKINTFIKQTADSVKALCKNKKDEYITSEFDLIDCERSSEKPCKYNDILPKNKLSKKIKCENGLPVHLTKCEWLSC